LLTTRRELVGGERVTETEVRRDPIVISRERERTLAEEFQRRWNGPPSAAQRRALVADAVDQELLFREAKVLALELGDGSVRRRLVEKMRLVGDRPGRGEDALVRDAVVDARAFAARFDEPDAPERGEVLRRAPGVELELGLERSDRALAVAQELEDADACGVPEHAEEVRLDLVDRTRVVRHPRTISTNLRILGD
jgi:hypothetical protein